MMAGFTVQSEKGESFHADVFEKEAPSTSKAFLAILPARIRLFHARFAGEEIFTEEGPLLDIPLENATNKLRVGEIGVFARSPRSPKGFKGGIAIVYGRDAHLIGCPNVFARIEERDLAVLKKVGLRIWKGGAEEFLFSRD